MSFMEKAIMKKFLLPAVCAVLSTFFFFSTVAVAAPVNAMPHWYVGAGGNKLELNRLTYTQSVKVAPVVIDGNDRYGFQVFVGHQQNNYFAVELGYADIPKMVLANNDPAPDRSIHLEADLWDIYLNGIFRYPVIANHFFAFLTLGMAFFNSEINSRVPGFSQLDEKGRSSSFAFAYAGGVEFEMKNWGIRFAYNGFAISLTSELIGGGFPNINYMELSLFYRFG